MGNKFRDWRHIAAFLLLASLSYADCVGYNETFGVQVVDAEYRSMPGAAVTVDIRPRDVLRGAVFHHTAGVYGRHRPGAVHDIQPGNEHALH